MLMMKLNNAKLPAHQKQEMKRKIDAISQPVGSAR